MVKMTLFKSIICFLIIASASAFTVGRPNSVTSSTALFAGKGDQEGGAAIAKPKVNIGQKTAMVTETKQVVVQKKRAQTSGPESRREEKFEDAPMYKVMLLGDEEYDQEHVIRRICETMEDIDEDQAASVFTQAQQGGKAMCGKYPFEYAELYKEQLLRSDPMIFSDIEEENKTGKK